MTRPAYFMLIFPLFVWGFSVDYYGNVDWSHDRYFLTVADKDTPPGWRRDERLSLNDGKESISPRGIADASYRIHAVWKDNRRLHGRDEIHYRVRIDTLWDTLVCISNLDTAHNSPWIAVDSKNNIHVVFLRWFGVPYAYYDVGYRKYNAETGIWEPEERVTYFDSISLSGRPKILCDANDILFAFWLKDRENPPTIWYATNSGSGWSQKMRVTDTTDSPNGYFGVTVAPENLIHCVWQDYRTGNAEIYHKFYQNGIWTQSKPVTANGFTSVYPRISPDSSSDIHLVYGGGTSLNEKIHYLVWDAQTHLWGPETAFPSQMALPHVDIAVDRKSDDVHLVFHEAIGGNIEIVYKYYDAQTGEWKPNQQLTFNYPGLRLDPQIALDPGGYVHLLWWDERDQTGEEEIYYKTNRLAPEVTEGDVSTIPIGTFYPNPFTGQVYFGITPETIVDVNGRVVKRLDKPFWDGRDNSGKECRAGIYYAIGNRRLKIVKIR